MPTTNYNGSVPVITYTVSDGTATDTSTLTLSVSAVNDAPVDGNETNTTNEDTTLTVADGATGDLLNNATDADGNPLTITAFSVAGQVGPFTVGSPFLISGVGTLTINANGSYTFAPAANYNGSVPVITYTVSDGTATDTSTLTLSVSAVNDAPSMETTPRRTMTNALRRRMATRQHDERRYDLTVADGATGDLLNNATDADGNPLTITAFSVAGQAGPFTVGTPFLISGVGTLTVNANGSYTFAPAANYNGAVPVITYTVSDGQGGSDTSTLALTVSAVNDAPVDGNETNTATEDVTLTVTDGATGDLLNNATDVDGNPLTITAFSVASQTGPFTVGSPFVISGVGTLTINANGSYTFTPAANYNGSVPVITYTVSDGQGGTDTSTLTLSVSAANDAPIAQNNGPTAAIPGISTNIDVLGNDTDSDGDTLTISGIVDPDDPGATIPVAVGTTIKLATGTTVALLVDGTLDVTLAAGSGSFESFGYQVSDGRGGTSIGTITVARDTDGDKVANYIDIDDDNDGIRDALERPTADSFTTTMWLADDSGNLIRVDNPEVKPSITVVGSLGVTVGDLAMAPDGRLYGVRFDVVNPVVYEIDTANAALTVQGTLPPIFATPNSLSFDARGIAYVGYADSDVIYRFDPTDPARAEAWHSMGYGASAGDAVFLDDVAYTAWVDEQGVYQLIQLALDTDNNVLASTVLGILPKAIYGMTAEANGQLYIVADIGDGTHGLYAIDLPATPLADGRGTISTTLVPGTSTAGQYFGATSNRDALLGATLDTDGDSIADHLDIDSDNDGITDNVEAQATAGYTAPSGGVNGKGLDQSYLSAGLSPVDTDGDGTQDYRDFDSDNDGMLDISERGDGQPQVVTSTNDADTDGLLDIFEGSDANDGYDVNDENINGAGNFNLASVPALNANGSNAIPLSRDLSFRDVNDAPVDGNETNTTNEDTTLTVADGATGDLLNNASDVDGNPLTITAFSVAGQAGPFTVGTPFLISGVGTLTINANGSYTFAPAANYNGSVPVITYTVSDGTATDTSTLTLSITAVNDAPVDGNETNTTNEDTTLTVADGATGDLLNNATDADGNPLTITAFSVAGQAGPFTVGSPFLISGVGTLTVNANGSYTFVPTTNYNGSVPVITYTVSDGTATDTSTLTLSVTP